jgi:hypothetical protein
VKITQDAVLGLIFLATGLFALFIASGYPLGTTGRMGPGYFPVIISIVLAGTGATLIVRSRFVASELLTSLPMKPIVLVTLGVVLFGMVVKGLGMPLAVFILVVVAASSSSHFKLSVKALAGAVAFAIACTLVFVTFLHMPMPVIGTWLESIGL